MIDRRSSPSRKTAAGPALRGGSGETRCFAAVAAAAAAVLWTVGLVTAMPPTWLWLILMTAIFSNLVAVVAGLILSGSGGRLGGLAGGVSMGFVLLFLGALFTKSDGAAAVTQRVPQPREPPPRLRVLDFNILHGFPRFDRQEERFEGLIAALRALDPDIVILQEAWSISGHGELAARLGEELGTDVAYAPANGSRRLIGFEEGSAVLSRLPILAARRAILAPRKSFWRTRIALFVTLDLGGGERLTVVGTHLADGAPEIAGAQGSDLAARLPSDGFLVVAGDLNAGSDSRAAKALAARGLVDAVPGGIDHVFVRPGRGWTVAGADWTLRPRDLADLIGEEVAISDHPGIVVDLERRQRMGISSPPH